MISVLSPSGVPSTPPGFLLYSAQAKTYTLLQEPGGGWGNESVPDGATPAVVSGDVMALNALSSPGSYAQTPVNDGTFALATGGDTSRQSIVGDVYDYSLRAYYGATTFYVGNQAPTLTSDDPAEVAVYFYPLNVAISAEDDSALATDFEGDALSVTDIDALPAGLTRGGNSVTGTPTVRAINHTTTRWTDIAGDYVEGDITRVIGQVDVPDVEGGDFGTGEATLEETYLSAALNFAYSASVAAGLVISQSPAAEAFADPGSTVTLTVSLGATVTPATDGYTITITPAANGAIRAVGVRRGATAPSAAQIDAHTDGDDVAADAFTSLTGSNGVDADIVLTGLSLPKYDLYIADAGDIVSAMTDQLKSAPSGRQYAEVEL